MAREGLYTGCYLGLCPVLVEVLRQQPMMVGYPQPNLICAGRHHRWTFGRCGHTTI